MSQSREDYIKFIHQFGEGKPVYNKEIAEGLQVAPPSVSEMVAKLAEDGLVDYRPYHGSSLTPKGTKRAMNIIRKHLIWEYFLSKKLNYNEEEVHDLAEEFEHVTPDDLADRLAKYIDFPSSILEEKIHEFD